MFNIDEIVKEIEEDSLFYAIMPLEIIVLHMSSRILIVFNDKQDMDLYRLCCKDRSNGVVRIEYYLTGDLRLEC